MSHPAPDTLVAFLQGELAPADVVPLEEHLLTCPECVLALDQLGSAESDTFLSRLRSMHDDGPSSGPTQVGSLPARAPEKTSGTEKLKPRPAPPPKASALKSGRAYRWVWITGVLTASAYLSLCFGSLLSSKRTPGVTPDPLPQIPTKQTLPSLTELIGQAQASLAADEIKHADERLKLAHQHLSDPTVTAAQRGKVYLLTGYVRQRLSKLDDAVAMFARVLELPGDSDDHAAAAFRLGKLALERSQFDKADVLLKRAADWQERRQTKGLALWEVRLAQADVFAAQKRYAQAETFYEEVVELLQPFDAQTHREVEAKLLRLEFAQEKWLAAETRSLAMVEDLRRDHGPEAEKVLKAEETLLDLYLRKGDAGSAEPIRRRHLAVRTQQLGTDHSRVQELAESLVRCYLEQGKGAEAERALAAHPLVKNSALLGRAFALQKKYVAAEPLLLASYRADPRTETRQWLVELYDAWGKPEEAKKRRGTVNGS